jgi:hypothetical protein
MPKPTRPALTAEFVRSVLDYDEATGIFRWRSRPDRSKRWNTRYAGTVAGAAVKGYVHIQLPKPRNYYAHTLAWLYVYGEWRPDELDHANGDRSDNRIENLRIANYSENACNKARQKNNKSGVAGVSFHPGSGKWRARINKDGKKVFDGLFDTVEEAAGVLNYWLTKIHGPFRRYRHHDRPSALDLG